ncbi:Asp23/Gls24 family envelope stress response protein [Kribbella sp. NPDC051587]|uniref:Asp23/Gls24 family envelope stress response protein n=1 Tax=Kribbella sp. NPDC051587 TaxID=3364119 RepID=UPI0037BBB9EC
MADTAALTRPQPLNTAIATTATDPDERGSLEISPRAIERIAETAALQAPAVIRQDATFGRGLPKVKAQQAGRRLRLDVEVAIAWGHPLADTAAEIRNRVATTVADLTGLGVDLVNVDISAVTLSTPDRPTDTPRRANEQQRR